MVRDRVGAGGAERIDDRVDHESVLTRVLLRVEERFCALAGAGHRSRSHCITRAPHE